MSNASPERLRAHIERMLARSEKRLRLTEKLVDKWKARLAVLDRAGVADAQARLWTEEQTDATSVKGRGDDPHHDY